MKGSDFENINMRAREAFLIACIWSKLGNYFFTDMEMYVSHRCPDFTELYENYDEYLLENNPTEEPFPYTEKDFKELKEIFSNQSVASLLVGYLDDFTPNGVYYAHDPETDYRILDKCIALLNSYSIPLPPFENFVPFVWFETETHGGSYTRQDFFKVL
jgi:hypothetical protein